EDRVDVDAAVPATQRVADLQVAVHRAAPRRAWRTGGQPGLRVAPGHALDRHLAALAAVPHRVDRDRLGQAIDPRRSGRVLLPVARPALLVAHRLQAIVAERLEIDVALVADGRDGAVGQRERLAVTGDGDGCHCECHRYSPRVLVK